MLYTCEQLNMDSFSIFTENFELASAVHSYNTRSERNGLLSVPSYNSVRFGRKSIIHSTNLIWNHLQNKLTEYDFLNLLSKSLKILLLKLFLLMITSGKTVDNFLVYTIQFLLIPVGGGIDPCWRLEAMHTHPNL